MAWKSSKKVLCLYDEKDNIETFFDNCLQMAEYLEMSLNGIHLSLHRGKCLKDGRKVMWVNVEG